MDRSIFKLLLNWLLHFVPLWIIIILFTVLPYIHFR